MAVSFFFYYKKEMIILKYLEAFWFLIKNKIYKHILKLQNQLNFLGQSRSNTYFAFYLKKLTENIVYMSAKTLCKQKLH